MQPICLFPSLSLLFLLLLPLPEDELWNRLLCKSERVRGEREKKTSFKCQEMNFMQRKINFSSTLNYIPLLIILHQQTCTEVMRKLFFFLKLLKSFHLSLFLIIPLLLRNSFQMSTMFFFMDVQVKFIVWSFFLFKTFYFPVRSALTHICVLTFCIAHTAM